MRRLMVLAVVVLLLGACGAPRVEVFPSPDPSLAARASATAASPSPSSGSSPTESIPPETANPSREPSPQPAVEDTAGPEVASPDTPLVPETSVPAVFRPIGGINDPQGDLPRNAPAWADIIGLVLEDDGTHLRIQIDVADDLPAHLRNNETARIGVDLFRGDDGETRYQLFVDGNDEGWLAYLQRDDGFVEYPGSVTIAGSKLAMSLPAAAVGDPVRGDWRAFSEWSDPGGGRREARDAAPDEGWGTFTR